MHVDRRYAFAANLLARIATLISLEPPQPRPDMLTACPSQSGPNVGDASDALPAFGRQEHAPGFGGRLVSLPG